MLPQYLRSNLDGGLMKSIRVVILVGCAWMLSLCAAAPSMAETPVNIGVIAKRGAAQTMQAWQETAKYLSEKLGRPFRIVPLNFTQMEPALQNRSIDFLLPNPAFFVRFQEKYHLKALVTMVNQKGIFGLDKFGSVLFTRKESKITNLQDIRGKRFMCVKFTSFGGAYMALRLLKESGIDPKRDCSAFTEGGTHDNVVMAVLNKQTDVGTVRSDTLERMAEEGKIKMDDFRIINQIKDGFQFIHSTRLYPEWPFAACGATDPKLARDVAKALILLKSTDKALMDAKVYSWTYPADYSDVTACLRVIGAL
jgi:phosphate/phosphite/phosphonate ABC transporter binding protein